MLDLWISSLLGLNYFKTWVHIVTTNVSQTLISKCEQLSDENCFSSWFGTRDSRFTLLVQEIRNKDK